MNHPAFPHLLPTSLDSFVPVGVDSPLNTPQVRQNPKGWGRGYRRWLSRGQETPLLERGRARRTHARQALLCCFARLISENPPRGGRSTYCRGARGSTTWTGGNREDVQRALGRAYISACMHKSTWVSRECVCRLVSSRERQTTHRTHPPTFHMPPPPWLAQNRRWLVALPGVSTTPHEG